MNSVVIVPTAAEAEHIDPSRVRLVIGGVGMAAISATLSRLLCDLRAESLGLPEPLERPGHPEMVILAGIAGVYPGTGLSVGDVALVATERVADLGAMRGERFEPLYTKEYHCPHVTRFPSFKAVDANTVNCAATPRLADAQVCSAPTPAGCGEWPARPGLTACAAQALAGPSSAPASLLTPAQLENMEGAAFFAICLAHGVPFLELRAISNTVGDPHATWDIPRATRNLASALDDLLVEIDG